MPDFDLDSALAVPEVPPDTRKVPCEHEVVDYGIESSDYFQGIGRGRFDDVFVGAGDTPNEALSDALDQAAHEWKVDDIESPYTEQHDRDYSASDRARQNWEAELSPDEVELEDGEEDTPENRQACIDAMWQEACAHDAVANLYYYVGLRLRERTEDDV